MCNSNFQFFFIYLLEEIHLNIADENDLEFNGSMLVKKRGRTTGDTIGKLVDECIHVCIDSYVFQNWTLTQFFLTKGIPVLEYL